MGEFETVQKRISCHAALTPDKIALVLENQTLDFKTLNHQSLKLAAALQNTGISRGDSVAICMEAGINYIVAILAVLQAGAAYVPLSVTQPVKRQQLIIETANTKLLICDQNSLSKYAKHSTNMITFDALAAKDDHISDVQNHDLDGDDLACIFFTSGSSGVPKGVKTLHGNLAYYSQWASRFFGDTIANKVPLTASIHFAAATSQIFSCFSAGQTLMMLPDYQKDPEKLMGWYQQNPDYGLHCVPSVWSGCLKYLAQNHGAAGPKTLFVSGEIFPDQMWQRTAKLRPDTPVYSLYGPAESVANVSYSKLDPAGSVTIGKAIAGSKIFVVDDDGALAQAGKSGRLFIAGPGICPAYMNVDNQQTPILQDFNSPQTGTLQAYDTGDYGRLQSNGEIRFIGRKDQQIKLNGQRIELAEIENALLGHRAVHHAAVILCETQLVAYVECSLEPDLANKELPIFLSEILPAIMVPQHYVLLDQIPRLSSGKIDRNGLPAFDLQRAGRKTIPPKTQKERTIIAIFEQVTDCSPVSMDDSFFALGGNSLGCFALISEIHETFGLRLDYQTIYQSPTPAGLLDKLGNPVEKSPDPPPHSPNQTSHLPMSSGQRGLWLHLQIHKESNAYNLNYQLTITGKLDQSRFNQAFQTLCKRHPMLQSAIREDGFEISSAPPAPPDFTDLSTTPATVLTDKMARMGAQPFLPDDPRFFRAHLFKTGNNKHVLAFVAHHIIFDGLSAVSFFTELSALYENDNGLPVVADFGLISQRENAYLASKSFETDKEYWQQYLSGLQDQPSFPVAYKGAKTLVGKQITRRINDQTRQELQRLAQSNNISLHVVFLALFAATMFSVGRAGEYVVAAPFANRHSQRESGIIGYLANILLYRIDCDGPKTLGDMMQNIAKDTVQFLDHQQFPLEETVAILRKQAAELPASVFNLMFAYHDVSSWVGEVDGGLKFTSREFHSGQSKCNLYLECFDHGNEIELHLTYDKSAIDAGAADRFIDKITDAAKHLQEIINTPLPDFAKPDLNERAAILQHCQGATVDHQSKLTLHNLYHLKSRQFPANPAIYFQGKTLTYADLDEMIQSTSAYLGQLDPWPKTPVAILMDHCPQMVATILACARLGIIYVPIDPTYPLERIKYITTHANIQHILTTSDQIGGLQINGVGFHALDGLENTGAQSSGAGQPAGPDDLLYIIYTSGTTGQPKGVMVPNRGVANYLLWMKDCFATDQNSRILAKTSASFDISTWELFLPLISGGALVLKPRENLKSPEQIAKVIRDHAVDIVQFVPSGLRLFGQAGMLANIPSVRIIFCGGETLSAGLTEQVLGDNSKCRLINLYGPTEASIFTSWNDCSLQSPYQKEPIGRPIANSAIYVLGDDLELMPLNAAGDLYIGGDNLAGGYLGDRDKTAKAFVAATAPLPEQILYATGDKGRLLSNGMFEYLGRNDRQVKIRGYRVECQEIESLIETMAGVSQAVALIKDHGNNDRRLHVVAVKNPRITLQAAEISTYLRHRLPTYMLPSTIGFGEKIPTLGNGKIDYAKTALLAAAGGKATRKPARNSKTEAIIFSIWAEVIGNENFTLDDNFFDVGGHSALFLKVRDLINKRLNANFNIADLYKSPNIASLVEDYKDGLKEPNSNPAYKAIRERVMKRKARYRVKHNGK